MVDEKVLLKRVAKFCDLLFLSVPPVCHEYKDLNFDPQLNLTIKALPTYTVFNTARSSSSKDVRAGFLFVSNKNAYL